MIDTSVQRINLIKYSNFVFKRVSGTENNFRVVGYEVVVVGLITLNQDDPVLGSDVSRYTDKFMSKR